MRILVNGSRREELETMLADFAPGELMEKLGTLLFQEGQLVVGVKVDGLDVTGGDRAEWGRRADVHELALTTETPRQLVMDSVRVSREWLPPLRVELSACADHFRLGDDAQAIDSLIRVVEGLRLLFVGVGQIQRLLTGQKSESGARVEEFQTEIPRLLDEIIAAQEGRDWILLADLLEYDVADQLLGWEEMCDSILEELA
jgi:hypothetical protein